MITALSLTLVCGSGRPDDAKPLSGIHRVVFLGDSITYSGQYIEYLEAYLRTNNPDLRCEFLNLGLPSETVSGLTEPGHAGGSFPRPDLHERLGRILDQTKPDLVVACYGMNDGIYHPYGDERFKKYRDGMIRLRDKVTTSGAKLILLTPPVFDSVPIKSQTVPSGLAEYRQPYEGYDEVLNLYAAWLLAQRGNGWEVIDVHGPMKQFLAEQREHEPKFRLASDGVHIDSSGHWLIAHEFLVHLKLPVDDLRHAPTADRAMKWTPKATEALVLIQNRQRLLKDSWISTIGHQRPGMAKGLPLEQSTTQAKAIDLELEKLLSVGDQDQLKPDPHKLK